MGNMIKDELFWYNFESWICYFRLNIHRFIVEYLGVPLRFFQKIIVYMMDNPSCKTISTFVWFASRGLGKSFLAAVWAVAKAILYPGVKIKLASATARQSTVLIKKIEDLRNDYPNIATEIKDIFRSQDSGKVVFFNGSVIETVVSGSGGKGERANFIICDESRLMNEEDISTNLMPFLTGRRTPPFIRNPKYQKYMESEPNGMIYLTSIGYKDEWSYKSFEEYANFIADGRTDYCIFSLPYQFGVEAGIISGDFIEKQIREQQTDPKIFRMEMEVIPYGDSEHSMFRYDILKKSRKLKIPLCPITDDEFIQYRGDVTKTKCYQEKLYGEIRVVSMDIAVAAGRANDNTVFIVFRLTANGDYYDKEVSYIEVMNGVNLDDQILRLKQLFYNLECDYAVIDAGGALGINAANACGGITRDIVRGVNYPGWKTCNSQDKFDMRVTDPNAVPVLYCIQVSGMGASAMQYNMLVTAQLEFERKRILLLVDEDEAVDDMNRRYSYFRMKTGKSPVEREIANRLMSSFANTTRLIDEAINTQVKKTATGRFTFDEGAGRKDRIICLIYGLYFINKMEDELRSFKQEVKVKDYYSQSAASNHFTAGGRNPFANNFDRIKGFGWRK